MNMNDANIIITILELALEDNWRYVAQELQDGGYSPNEVISAWKKLEKIAGISGTAPCKEDF